MKLFTNGLKKLPFYIDDEDYSLISMFKWYPQKRPDGGYYIYTNYHGRLIYLHRLVMDFPKKKEIDHMNHKKHDNRKTNLCICTHFKNMQNIKNKKHTVNNKKYEAVCGINYDSRHNLWKVRYRGKHIGYFKKYDNAVIYLKSYIKPKKYESINL